MAARDSGHSTLVRFTTLLGVAVNLSDLRDLLPGFAETDEAPWSQPRDYPPGWLPYDEWKRCTKQVHAITKAEYDAGVEP